jgi:hypothetical protein
VITEDELAGVLVYSLPDAGAPRDQAGRVFVQVRVVEGPSAGRTTMTVVPKGSRTDLSETVGNLMAPSTRLYSAFPDEREQEFFAHVERALSSGSGR